MDLDKTLIESRQRANDLALQKQMLGEPIDLVHLEATKNAPDKADKSGEPGKESLGNDPNVRSNEEIDAILAQQKASEYENDPLIQATHTLINHGAEAIKQAVSASGVPDVLEGAKKAGEGVAGDVLPAVGDPRFEAVGAGLTTGGVVTGEAPMALLGVGMMGMSKGANLIRKRFQVEGIVERALNPSPLGERVSNVLNEKTAVLSDAVAGERAKELVRDGGVSRETLTRYAPGTSLASAPHALAAQEIVTAESRSFVDTARTALDSNNPQLAEQALAQLARLLDPAASFSGAVTTTAQTLRVASSEDVKALNLILERTAKTTEGMSPLDKLKFILSDPATDPAKQGKSVTQSLLNLRAQAQEIVATGNDDAAQVLLHEIQSTVQEEAQLGLFPEPEQVKEAQQVYKQITELHTKEANEGAARRAEDTFSLTPTGPTPIKPVQQTFLLKPINPGDQLTNDQIKEFNARLAKASEEQSRLTHSTAPGGKTQQQSLFAKPIKPGQQLTDDQVREYNRQVAIASDASKDKFRLTPQTSGVQKPKQPDFIAEDEKNRLATIKEHQAQDLRVSEGTSVFSPKRTPFKLTPPPGGARRPPKPKQLDLLNIIAAEPEPEQLALEMAASIEHPELSKQFLSMIRKAQKAIELGSTEDVGKALTKLQDSLVVKEKDPNKVTQPSRLVAQEKKALQTFLMKDSNKNLSPKELLQALLVDPDLQPEAIIAAINNAKNPTWRDAWQYLIINSMLTPVSDFVNFIATASMVPVHIAARTTGARAGQVSQVLGGKAGVLLGEDEAMLHGLYASFWDSVRLAGRVVKTNIPEIGPSVVRESQLGQNPLSSAAVFGYSPTARKIAGITSASDAASSNMLSRAGIVSRAIDTIGVTTGLPGRLMLTGDQFIQSLAMSAEQHALVYRRAGEQAIREGWTEKQFYKAYRPMWKDISKNLPADIREKGEEFSLEVSLNKQLGSIGQSVMNTRETVDKYTGIGGTIALPFFRTLVNGAKATWEFSPLGPSTQAIGLVSKQFRDDMFGSDPVKRDLALGKWAVGTMMMSSMVWAAVNGRLRGRGPDNKELRQQTVEAKGLTDSFVLNADDGTSIQINRLGIIGNLAGMAADVAEVWLQADDLTKAEMAQLLVTAYVGNLSFDFLQNSGGVISAISNGVKRKEDLDLLAKNLVNLVPLAGTGRSVEKLVATEGNPVLMKDAKTTLEKILARFPGYDALADKYDLPRVPVLRNQWGYAVRQPHSAWGTEWFNPLYVSHPSQHEGLAELAEIEISLGVAISQPDQYVGKYNAKLTTEQYDEFKQLAGEQWEKRSLALLPTLRRKDIPDQRKKDLIETQLRESRTVAQHMLMSQQQTLRDTVAEHKRTLFQKPDLSIAGQ